MHTDLEGSTSYNEYGLHFSFHCSQLMRQIDTPLVTTDLDKGSELDNTHMDFIIIGSERMF